MPKTKTSGAKKTSAAKSGSAKKTTAAKPEQTEAQKAKAAEAAQAKREAREAQTAEQMTAVVKRVVNGDEKLAVVAKDLKITSGKAAFLIMLHRVAEGEVPKITGKDDETLLRNIQKERAKANEYSSWGWLAARSGRSEGFIKTGLENLNLYTPRAENIASLRSTAKPASASKTGGAKKTSSAKKTVRGNA